MLTSRRGRRKVWSLLLARTSDLAPGQRLFRTDRPRSQKRSAPDTPSAPATGPQTSGASARASSSLPPSSSEDDSSEDSEVVRAALAKSRSYVRRASPKTSPASASSAKPPVGSTPTSGRLLHHAMFGSSGSETESNSGKTAASTATGSKSGKRVTPSVKGYKSGNKVALDRSRGRRSLLR